MEKKGGKKPLVETKKIRFVLRDYRAGEKLKQQALDMKNLV
jgi:hypothetical protein